MVATEKTAAVSQKKKSEPNRTTFTPLALKYLPAPKPKQGADGQTIVTQRDFWDASTPGFGLRISSTGRRVWTLLARMPKDGQHAVRRFTIGLYSKSAGDGGLTLIDAREQANQYRRAIARGEDPTREKAEAKQKTLRESAQTFRAIAEEFLATHHPKKKAELRPSTLRRYRGLLLGPDVEAWATRPLASLTRTDVINLLHQMQRRKRVSGGKLTVSVNRMLAVLRKLFRWSIQQNLIALSPTNDIDPPAAEMPRDRHLFGNRQYDRPSELGLLWRACDGVAPFGAIPKLLLLTGQRLSEVAGMREDELIDLDGTDPRWLIPASRTKNGKKHLVPLGPLAVQTIRSLPRLANCPFIFSTTGTTPFSGFSGLKRRIDEQIGVLRKQHSAQYRAQCIEPWRFHDLRRTFKTGLAELGVGSDVRDGLVNHTKQGVDAHYDHAELTRGKREAMELWESHITGLMKFDAGRGVTRGK